jgi:hypothetical protein
MREAEGAGRGPVESVREGVDSRRLESKGHREQGPIQVRIRPAMAGWRETSGYVPPVLIPRPPEATPSSQHDPPVRGF